ncbi:hypothetical protein [Bdellovibrio bacteriovorus]|uniref:hypothetical protein n=1 Tax=Bdellovibrio bacteriovorus TaxID=959 RepID=UPI0035A6DE02
MEVLKRMIGIFKEASVIFKLLWVILLGLSIGATVVLIGNSTTLVKSDVIALILFIPLLLAVNGSFIWLESKADEVAWGGLSTPESRGFLSRIIIRCAMIYGIYSCYDVIVRNTSP